ncbi:bifunctional glycosyltransferase/CDP-glycerol:glycerophosphate glycerophosphotransferase [Agromyces mediolanus]|uniref:bifunctional glycosyltransferase/CDP-glycerol:glycerophosphate glycerophosphotransferase n=1 Tax=Agromyces mediolanus TaxID=41986 RepID=UPI001E3361EB|nr:CDP-glycerol glycerophosphotransferase family protein [Agromyces mediolanus]MCD1571749.1 bifunctional glycosyltransferase family 2 protein/CDP-glycerol:glycerophosphate glycerophosphotransferase [Agromyces mediolanus]
MHNLLLDLASHPRLLPLRERIRAARNWAAGVSLRASLAGRTEPRAGLLSIVVPMYGVEAYIDACLRSLMRQNYVDVEIIVIDDGSPDRSATIARSLGRRDPRIRVLSQPNAGLSAARNAGVAAARGEFLTFIDSDDTVDRHAFTQAVESLRATGSDFAVSPYRRLYRNAAPPAAPWIRSAHAAPRLATTIDEFPEILVNAVAWSKVYRRSFWDDAGLEFPIGALYEDQEVSAKAYASAARFDVLPVVSLNWRMREDQSSISQQVASVRNIMEHDRAMQASLSALEAHPMARATRIVQLVSNNLTEFFLLIRAMSDDAWTAFADSVASLIACIDDETTWDQIDARSKVMAHLVATGNRASALALLSSGGWQRELHPARLQGDGLNSDIPVPPDARSAVPSFAFRLSPRESSLETALVAATRRSDAIVFSTVALIAGLDAAAGVPIARVELVPETGGASTELTGSWRSDPAALAPYSHWYADRSGAVLDVTVPLELLQNSGRHRIRVELQIGELRRSGWIVRSKAHPGFAAFTDGNRIVGLTSDGDESSDAAAIIETTTRTPEITAFIVDGTSATVVIDGEEYDRLALVHTGDRFGTRRRVTPLREGPDGVSGRVSFALPRVVPADTAVGDWYLSVRHRDGGWHWAKTAAVLGGGRLRLEPLAREERSVAGIRVPGGAATARVTESDVRILGVGTSGDGAAAEHVVLELGPTSASQLDVVAGPHRLAAEMRNGRALIPLVASSFGMEPRVIPRGRYELTVQSGRLVVDQSLRTALPMSIETDELHVTLTSPTPSELELHVDVARPVEERGPGATERLRRAASSAPRATAARRSVLFRCLYSEAPNDTALALHHRLRERGADLDLIWATRDHSIRVPDGGRRVIEHSRAYFEAFAEADYVVVNVHQPDWFEKRDGQVVIETFHGYPFKLAGTPWWHRLGFPPERIESFYRRAEQWDYLVSPAPYATTHLREFFRERSFGTTEVLEIGYPRNDALFGAQAEALRQETRRALGIREGETVVLYAPTFRDYLSADDMSAEATSFLNMRELLRRLGPGHTVLMRGHPFHARSEARPLEGAIDVTAHPDVNALITASDAAILDYSSLRFDYALTEKPMVFLTPDRDRYFSERPPFVPYRETAPGPLVTSTAQAAAQLRDLDGLRHRWRARREEFRRRFTPLDDGHASDRLVDAVFVPRGDAR